MNIVIQPNLEAQPEFAEMARRASEWLPEAIGTPADRVKAVWGLRADEHGRPVLELTLVDWTGSLSGRYSPEELNSTLLARRRFIRQWGDLLQDYWHRREKQYELQDAESGEG
jgi:hypothetical protein